MKRALALAERGRGRVEPNPVVGCVIARAGETVAEGWHAVFGGPHAEAAALEAAGKAARGADVYVTLEPCAHTAKKTPPCAPALVRAGVARVVYAVADPNPATTGRGAAALREAGIRTEAGLCRTEAVRQNAAFFKHMALGMPLVTAKWAMTLDGRIAAPDGSSRWISSESSRIRVHALRGQVDAVMIGVGTAVRDDPELTCRLAPAPARIAARIVIDPRARLPLSSKLVASAGAAPVVIATGAGAPAANVAALRAAGCDVIALPETATGQLDLCSLLRTLGQRGMSHVLVEGGARLLGSLFDAGQIDRVVAFIAPKLLGAADAPGPLAGSGARTMPAARLLIEPTIESTGQDAIMTGWIRDPLEWARV